MITMKEDRRNALAAYIAENPGSTKAQIMDGLHWSSSQFDTAVASLRAEIEDFGEDSPVTLVVRHKRSQSNYTLTDDRELVLENAIHEGRYDWTREYNGIVRLVNYATKNGYAAEARIARRESDRLLNTVENLVRLFAGELGFPDVEVNAWFVRTREEREDAQLA